LKLSAIVEDCQKGKKNVSYKDHLIMKSFSPSHMLCFVLGLSQTSSKLAVVTAFLPSSSSSNNHNNKMMHQQITQRQHLQSQQCRTRLFLQSLQEHEDQYLQIAMNNQNTPNQPEIVYILMYNPGTDQEGVHTTEFPKDGSGSEVILGFEELGDCIQFANALKTNPNFPLEPIPTPVPLEQMQPAMENIGLSIMVVPTTTAHS
jgi:hypothetical protein